MRVSPIVHGIFFTGSTIGIWVQGYESLPAKFRSYATLSFGVGWVIGHCAVAPVAYWFEYWRDFLTILSLPGIVYSIVLWIFVPESFHFLISKNKHNEAKKWVAKCNLHFPDDQIRICRSTKADEAGSFKQQLHGFLTNKKIIYRTMIFAFLWTADVLVYFGMMHFSVVLVGNHYLNYIFMGLVEIPAYIVGPIMLEKIGRVLTVSLTHIVTAIAFILPAFILTSNPLAQLIFGLIAKFAISAAFMAIFVFAAESFPTTERNLCIGLCSILGKIFGCMAPFIQTTSAIWGPMPLILFGTFAAVAGLATFLLPETKNRQLPDTTDNMA